MSAKQLDELRMVDPVLTSVAAGYSNPELVADKIFPIVNVSKTKGKVPMFGKESFIVRDTERSIRSASNRVPTSSIGVIDFDTQEHDIESEIDYIEASEVDEGLKYEQKITHDLMDVIDLGREKAIADWLQQTSNYNANSKTELTSVNAFNNSFASETPIKIIEAAKNAIRNKIAKYPNVIIMGPETYQVLKNHQSLQNMLKYTEFPIMDETGLAKVFGVDKVVIGNAVCTDEDDNFKNVWGDNLILAYVANDETPTAYSPSCGYIFRKEGMPEVDTYYESGGKIKIIRCTDNYDFKVTCKDAIHLITGTCSA